MSEKTNPKEGNAWVPGGNSGVTINGVHYSNKGGSCIRKIILRNAGVNEPIDFRSKITFGVGDAIETLYGDYLESKGHTVERAVRTNSPIDTGQIYLDETDMVVDGIPYEIKSVVSTNKLKEVFVEKKASWDNVVQAAHHMIQFKSMAGRLVYICGCWHSCTVAGTKVSFKSGDIAAYDLEFDKKSGKLHVNGIEYPFGTRNLLQWRKFAGAFTMAKDVTVPHPEHPGILLGEKRPPDFENAVCHWCYWKEACKQDNYDDFIAVAKSLVEHGKG